MRSYVIIEKELKALNKEAKNTQVTPGMADNYQEEETYDSDQEAEHNEANQKSKSAPLLMIDVKAQEKAVTKIAAHMKGHIAREQYHLLKERRINLLYTVTERIDDYITKINVIKMLQDDPLKNLNKEEVIVTAQNLEQQKMLKRLVILPDIIPYINDWSVITRLVSYKLFKVIIYFLH